MDYKITYMDTAGLLCVKTSGLMNAVDFIYLAKDILAHPRWIPNGNVLFDHTSLDFSRISINELQEIRKFHLNNEEKIGNGRSAVVVKDSSGGSWEKLWSGGKKINTENQERVFENYEIALNWVK